MLATLLHENVDRIGSRTALVHGERRLTHAALADEVDRVARGLLGHGVEPGDNVLLVLPNVPEFVIGFFALARIGAAAVLLDVASKEHELTKAFRDCSPRAVLTDRRVAGTCHAVAGALGQTTVVVTIDDVPSSAVPFHELGDGPAELPPLPGPDTPLVYQYSSGSTGRPKRVGRTHAQCLAEARLVPETLGLSEEDATLCIVPLFHAYGLGDGMLTAIASGAKLVLQSDAQPFVVRRQRTLELIGDEQVTMLPVVPFMVDLLASAPSTREITNLRFCFSAGNALPAAAAEAFLGRFGVPARQLYGCTEAPSIAANLDDEPSAASVGRPFRHVEVAIRDGETGAELGAGEVGTVSVRTPVAAAGYVDGSDVETFRDGWVYPGDDGHVDEDGRLTLVGRTRVFIDVVGHKVDPVEVEEVLLEHPAVREVVVVGTRTPALDTDVVKAAVVPEEPCSERELIHFCATRLASFKVPQVVEFLDAIPRSPLGKVLRKELV